MLGTNAWIAASLSRGLPVELVHHGWSMSPTIVPLDRVTVGVLSARPRVGMIVLARRGERMVVHRIRRIVPDPAGTEAYVLRGDANDRDDSPIASEQLLGEVIRIAPRRAGLRKVRRALRSLLDWAREARSA